MIRLRQFLEVALRHPLLGLLLLVFLGLVLAFMVFHTVEHGVEGLLFSCAILAAATVRLLAARGSTRRASTAAPTLFGRPPPRQVGRLLQPRRPAPLRLALPLRL